jgi:putative MFS transporter
MASYFFEQMDNWNFGFIAPQLIKTWHLTMPQIGRISFFYFLAMTLGGLCGGVISDFIGRRKTFLGAIAVFSLGSIACGWAPDLTTLIIARALTGFGIFCMMVCSQAYIAEISPAESRGKWQGLIAAVGFCAAPVIGLICRLVIPISPEAWRYVFYFGGLGLVAMGFGLKYLKESPRWLLAHKRIAEAEAVVEHITHVPVDLSQVAAVSPPKNSIRDTLTGMFSLKYLRRTGILGFYVILTVPAVFVVFAWTPTLLTKRGLEVADALLASFVLMIGVPVGCALSGLVSDKGGRKIPLSVLTIGVAVFAVVFALTKGFWPVVVAGFLLNVFVMSSSFTSYPYMAESYPTQMRNTAVGVHNSVGRFASSFMQVMVPVIFAARGVPGVYYTIAAMMVLPAIVVLAFGERTGGKSLEKIA